MAGSTSSGTSVAAWDLPTRIFHWSLVLAVVSAWASAEFSEDLGDVTLVWHRANGLFILVLVVWRVLWGFAGSSTSRFANFVAGPGAVLSYLTGLVAGARRRYLGHNPAGGAMVIALLATLLAIAGFGLFATDDNDLTGGPLHRLVSEGVNDLATSLHHRLFEPVLILLVVLHIAANAFYGVVKREPLVPAMVTGQKPAGEYADGPEAVIAGRPMLRAFACLLLAAGLVFGGIIGVGGRLW